MSGPLLHCPWCGTLAASDAPACIHCGQPLADADRDGIVSDEEARAFAAASRRSLAGVSGVERRIAPEAHCPSCAAVVLETAVSHCPACLAPLPWAPTYVGRLREFRKGPRLTPTVTSFGWKGRLLLSVAGLLAILLVIFPSNFALIACGPFYVVFLVVVWTHRGAKPPQPDDQYPR